MESNIIGYCLVGLVILGLIYCIIYIMISKALAKEERARRLKLMRNNARMLNKYLEGDKDDST